MDRDVESMGVRDLKELILSAGLDYADCVEVSDLRGKGREAQKVLRAAAKGGPEKNSVDAATKSLEALERGRKLYAHWAPKGTHACFKQITQQDLASVGGKQNFLKMFERFYEFIFADPRMNQLLDSRDRDTDVSAEEHGKRLGLWYLQRYSGDSEYQRIRGGNIFQNIATAHAKAQGCPMRPAKHRGKAFTCDQRDIWLGYQDLSMEQLKCPKDLRDKLMGLHAGYGMAFYAPFLDA